MMNEREQVDAVAESMSITVRTAARRAGVDVYIVRHCVEVGLMEEDLTERDLVELRRVRRLMTLGINLPGVEVILRMRRRIQELQTELARLERLNRS
jgi:hypothetical protein